MSLISMLGRIYTAFSPPVVEKKDGAIKVGILGAAKIAPMALITPAKSHPEVIVHSVAARDRSRAEAFAKKHGLAVVKDSYQDIIDDPEVDAIFIPLANSLHYEWAIRSLRAGKHVLLEKPSTCTAAEAEVLFNLPEFKKPNRPVLLEAFHSRFHPAVSMFLTFIKPADVVHVHTDCMVPWLLTDKDNIEFNYSVGGGSMMQLGTYSFLMLRLIFGAEPEECVSCDYKIFNDGVHDKCDTEATAKFRFPNGGIGEASSSLVGPILWKPSEARVTMKEVIVKDESLPSGQEKAMTRMATLHGFMHAIFWHRIDINDSYVIRNKADGRPIKKWVERKSHKAYSYKEVGGDFADLPGEHWWMSYRYQLEEFVNRVKGRKTNNWLSGESSVHQMRMLDMAYEKSGLGLRPTSDFK